jgi:hypothetical protein
MASPATLGVFAGGVLLLAGFVLWEAHSTHPMLGLRYFRNPRFSAAAATVTLGNFAFGGTLFLLTQFLQFVLGYTPLQAGIPDAAGRDRHYGAGAAVAAAGRPVSLRARDSWP